MKVHEPMTDPRRPADRRFHPLLLWLGILGGPLAFALVRLAGLVLLAGPCTQPGRNSVFGFSNAQWLMAAITIICALIAAAAALLSWHIWRRTARPEEEQTMAGLGSDGFWALGGLFLSAVFCVAIILTGGLAIGLSTPCVS
jgi:hypothetical protein